MTLETPEERNRLLKVGIQGKQIERLYLLRNGIKLVGGNALVDPWQKHPNGTTCAHCQHYPRCCRLISRQGDEDICDYAPSRFEAKVQEDIVCL